MCLGGHGFCAGQSLFGGLVDRGDDFELDNEIATDRAGDRVLDEAEEAGLDAVADQRVGHSEDDLPVLDG